MASPHIEVFFIYDGSGNPVTGGNPSFLTYKDDQGTDLSQPSITEIGGGAYKFTPVFGANRGIVYIVATDGTPSRVANFLRPEDYNLDNADGPVSTLIKISTGKWEIKISGSDANRMILYDVDGTTPLYKFDLLDSSGLPTAINPFKRSPV